MDKLNHIIENNIDWVNSIRAEKKDFFKSLVEQQEPDYLWIGCSDSRVPANQLMGLMPGDVFVHRNIANMVVHADFNTLAVIHYAVEYLKVKHIIVCGHYLCGGVRCALSDERFGSLDSWLQHIKDVERLHHDELSKLEGQAKEDRLCELNVMEQMYNVCKSPPVLDAWESGQELHVHCWIYGIADGKLQKIQASVSGKE
ncbi:MAG: carbonic anhydrase [Cryomorphaceae bacterium]|jgi:carbonic anhydrase